MRGISTTVIKSSWNKLLFESSLPSERLRVCVILPVRNEALHIEATLEALRNELDLAGSPLDPSSYEVLLLANNCSDNTHNISVQYQKQYPDFLLRTAAVDLPVADANIGTVRRMLMDEACHRFDIIDNKSGIIASTDGDTTVDAQWISFIIKEK